MQPTGSNKRTWIEASLGLAWLLFVLHTLGAFGDAGASFFDIWLYGSLLGASAVACFWRAATSPAGAAGLVADGRRR